MAVRSGDIIAGKYRVERILGSGGMGVVVSARHVELGWLRAIKVMHPEPGGGGGWAPRFRREASVGSKLHSEHAVRVFDVGGFDEGRPYLVMEHLEGTELAKVLRARGPLPVAEAALFVAQACDAIAEAHDLGVVHRDLKPANLFLTKNADGSPCIKVLDFGISKVGLADETSLSVTQTGEVIGSPAYMAPEQIRGFRDVGPRSDVWALGVILYELVTRRYPFPGRASVEMLAMVLEREPDPPSRHRADLPPGFEAVLLHCLQKDPARRMPSALALREALAPYLPLPPPPAERDEDVPTLQEDAPTLVAPRTWSVAPLPARPVPEPVVETVEIDLPEEEIQTLAMPPLSMPPLSGVPGVQRTVPLPAQGGPSTRVVLLVAATSLAIIAVTLTALIKRATPSATAGESAATATASAETAHGDAPASSSAPAETALPVASSAPAETAAPADGTTPAATSNAVADSGGRAAGKAGGAPAGSKATAEPREAAGAGRSIDQVAAMSALASAAAAARKCKKPGGPTGSARVEVTFGQSGRVTSARVGAPFEGTPVGKCIAAAFRGASVPPFEGSSFEAAKTVSIR
jgi:serine/threonine-protein kinase